jgi:hypothetical protein
MAALIVTALVVMVAAFVLAAVIRRAAPRAPRRFRSSRDPGSVAWADGGSGSDCSPGDAGCGDGGGDGGGGGD